MQLAPPIGLLSIALLVLANGFFVATEFAIVAVRRSRLEQLAAQGNPTAAAAQHVVGHLDTYIAACQLGITMASLGLGWIGEPALAHLIEPFIALVAGATAPAAAHALAIGISFTIITALHIVLGELAPKGLALQRPESTTLFITPPIRIFELIFRWPIAILNGIGNGVLRLAGLRPATGHEMVHSVEELRLLLTGSREAGVVEESEARIAGRAFSFADLTAGALMTHRTEVDAIDVDLPIDELAARIDASTHTRVPVYRESLDHIVGVLYVPDFYRALRRATPDQPLDLASILRPAMVVPASKPADDLLDEMRTSGRFFAVIIDEYGGTAGILTLEDLVEALVGPLHHEPVTAGDPDTADFIVRSEDGSVVVDGLMRLEELEDAIGLRFTSADHEEVETVGGLIMTRLGRIPEQGDTVAVSGRVLRVERLDGLRVALVRILPPGTDDPDVTR